MKEGGHVSINVMLCGDGMDGWVTYDTVRDMCGYGYGYGYVNVTL